VLRPRQVSFRVYRPADREACLRLFDANCPAFFAPNERADYLAFLDAEAADYEVCLSGDRLVGAFGLSPGAPEERSLRWILLHPELHGHGLGSAIMTRVLSVARDAGVRRLRIAASHRSSPFFARFGAQVVATTPDGWGPGMHRVDMELAL